jgi:hypothetical protein
MRHEINNLGSKRLSMLRDLLRSKNNQDAPMVPKSLHPEHQRELKVATDKARRKGLRDAVRGKDGSDDFAYLEEVKRADGLSEVHQHHYHDEIIAAYGEGWRVGKATKPDREASFNGWFWGVALALLFVYLFKQIS